MSEEKTREKILAEHAKGKKKALGRLIESKVFWITIVVISLALPLVRSITKKLPETLPILGELRPFELMDQDRQAVTLESLRGRVLVVNFIFTTCPSVCPLLTQQMAKIQSRLRTARQQVKLLSISVDPETDTPEVLKNYGEKYEALFEQWSFLTGPLDKIENAVIDSFKVAMDFVRKPVNVGSTTLMDITHGQHFVIVDQKSRIRAYRTANNNKEINKIVQDVTLLLNYPDSVSGIQTPTR